MKPSARLSPQLWQRLPAALLPMAESMEGLPAARLLRLSLVQVSVGLALTLLNGTLNRVMIVEIGVPAWQVALFIGLPLLLAPVRALFGFRSDVHISVLGWRRVPYIWFGSLALFGGLALTPMSIILLSGAGVAPATAGQAGVLLEPFGGEILGLTVGATTQLTALWAIGMLAGFVLAARKMRQGTDPYLLAGAVTLIGIPAFSALVFSGALDLPWLFRMGAGAIGFGGGIASVALLSAATALAEDGRFGFAAGVWGTVQALSAGLAVGLGGLLRDVAAPLAAATGRPDAPYAIVYHVEIGLLFAALVALGPLARRMSDPETTPTPCAAPVLRDMPL